MTSIKERYKRLESFKPVYLLESLDEELGVIHQLIFYPSLSVFKIISSGEEDYPPIVISYNDFVRNKDKDRFNSKNYIDSIIVKMMDLWSRMKDSEKMSFCDNVPLNSLYLGCQYV